ncbi:hypothetical protein Tco_0661179 [Tanacetum coccineum]
MKNLRFKGGKVKLTLKILQKQGLVQLTNEEYKEKKSLHAKRSLKLDFKKIRLVLKRLIQLVRVVSKSKLEVNFRKDFVQGRLNNYLKNQGSWKLNQLRKLSFEEVKEEASNKDSKRLKEDKDDEAKDDEPTKKLTKRRKQIARKGMHTSMDENVSDDSDKVDEQEETNTGSKGLTSPDQTATGKGISNPLMAVMVCQKPYGSQLTICFKY